MIKLQEFLQKWRVRLGHIFAIFVIIFAKPEILTLAAGSAVALIGEAVRIYSAGMINKNEMLSRGGPYAYVRNPLYVGSFLMYLGFCIASGNLLVLAVYPVFFYIVYFATILREEAFLRDKFSDMYQEFCREVPRFLPRITPAAANDESRFELAQAFRNREHEGFIAVILILGLLWAMNLTNFNVVGMIAGR